jgi:hypothetical protein
MKSAVFQSALVQIDRNASAAVALIAAAIVLAGVAYSIQLGPQLPYWDEREYYALARGLVERGEYEHANLRAFRAPAYPFFLAGLMKLGLPPWGLRTADFILLAGTAILLYRLASRFSGVRLSGVLAASGIFAYPVLIYAAGKLYPQTLAGFLFLLSLDVLLRRERPGAGRAFAGGAAFGLLVLTVPIFLPLLGLLLLWLVWPPGPRTLPSALIVLVTTGAVLAPWTIRNYSLFGRWGVVTTNMGLNLLIGNSENARPGLGTNIDLEHYHEAARGLGELERDRFFRDKALEWLRENPREAVDLYVGKLVQHFSCREELATSSEASRFRTFLMAVTYIPLLGIAAVGLLLGLGRRPHPIEVMLWALYVAGALLMAVFFTRIRFRLPLDLMLLALAGGTLGRIAGRITRGK